MAITFLQPGLVFSGQSSGFAVVVFGTVEYGRPELSVGFLDSRGTTGVQAMEGWHLVQIKEAIPFPILIGVPVFSRTLAVTLGR